MSVPAHIADRVNEALGALYRHPEQTLLPWYRYAIYAAIAQEPSRASHACRAWIDVLSAQHVLFCWQPYARSGWQAAWLQPADLLGTAEQALHGIADPNAARRLLARAEALADMLGEPATSARYPAWCVFEAALRALRGAWAYHTFGATQPGSNESAAAMIELDDASRYAAIAVAGQPTHECGKRQTRAEHADWVAAEAMAAAQLRQTFFWEWWLREAIPQAYRSYERHAPIRHERC